MSAAELYCKKYTDYEAKVLAIKNIMRHKFYVRRRTLKLTTEDKEIKERIGIVLSTYPEIRFYVVVLNGPHRPRSNIFSVKFYAEEEFLGVDPKLILMAPALPHYWHTVPAKNLRIIDEATLSSFEYFTKQYVRYSKQNLRMRLERALIEANSKFSDTSVAAAAPVDDQVPPPRLQLRPDPDAVEPSASPAPPPQSQSQRLPDPLEKILLAPAHSKPRPQKSRSIDKIILTGSTGRQKS